MAAEATVAEETASAEADTAAEAAEVVDLAEAASEVVVKEVVAPAMGAAA